MPTGYRRGDIGTFSGGNPKEAGVAWKALNFEYEELGNKHTLEDTARFLRIKPTTWNKVLDEFRQRHGNAKGIWLTRTKEASRLYKEFGPVEKVHYDEKDVIVDLGYDGIYVLDERTPEDLSLPDSGYMAEKGWVYHTDEEMKKRKREWRKKSKKRDREASLVGVR